MALPTKETGCMGGHRAMALSFTQSVTLIRDSGLGTELVGTVNTLVPSMEARIKESGRMICRRDMAWKSGVKTKADTRESLSGESNKEMGSRFGQMARFSRDNGGPT